jgi:hypothetical protein
MSPRQVLDSRSCETWRMQMLGLVKEKIRKRAYADDDDTRFDGKATNERYQKQRKWRIKGTRV